MKKKNLSYFSSFGIDNIKIRMTTKKDLFSYTQDEQTRLNMNTQGKHRMEIKLIIIFFCICFFFADHYFNIDIDFL